jgi:hypothetical protein
MSPIEKVAARLSKTSRWVYLGEDKISLSRFKKEGIADCFPEVLKEYGLLDLPRSKHFEITEKILPLIKRRMSDMRTNQTTEEIITSFFGGNILFEDMGKAGDFLVFDTEKREVTEEFDAQVILRRIPKDKKLEVINNLPIATMAYDAYDSNPSKKITRNSIPIVALNLYSPQRWRKEYPNPKEEWEGQPPTLFKRFLEYLVPDKNEQTEVISWICWALTKRHQSYLILRGNRGNGKTIFMKMIMGVIGDGYVALDGAEQGFNADLKHKRVIGIDDDTEIGSREGYKTRKRMINSMVTFNEKHKQTKESEEQFASYIICSNPSDPFHTEYDERRVVQTTLTKKKLLDLMTAKERDFLDKLANIEESLNDVQTEFLAQLGHWLLAQAKENPREAVHCYKGGTFWDDVIKSLGGFKRRAVERILARESSEYGFEELCYDWKEDKSNRQVIPHWSTFKVFLESFQYMDENLIESIDEKEKTFKPNEKYYPIDFEEFDDEEFDI